MQRILVIINPVSGVHRSRKLADSILTEFQKHEIKAEIEETQRRYHAYDLAQEVKNSDFDKVVAVGGDGTINEIAMGLADSENLNCKIAVIPTGVGNFIAKTLGVTKDYRKAVYVAVNGNVKEIDTFKANSETHGQKNVLGCLGVGYDSHIVHDIDSNRTGKRLTKLSYCFKCAKHAFRRYNDKIRVIIDDVPLDGEFYWVEAVNTKEYGGGFVFSPEADCSDGLLDIVTFSKPVHRRKIKYAWGLSTGRMLNNSWVQMHRGQNVRIESENPLPIQIDGDFAGFTPVEIEYSGLKVKFASKH